MPEFVYRSRDAQGQLQDGTIEAHNLRDATRQLMAQKLTVIEIRVKGGQAGGGGFPFLLFLLVAVAAAAYFWIL
jgi:type II secretory pathway component PulF